MTRTPNLDDHYLWLEEVTGEPALDWVRTRNAETVATFAASAEFTERQDRIRGVLDTDARIPYVRRRGAYLYNFWRDAVHVRGLWRRTTMDSYRTESPDWEVLVDLDALAATEDENWVWSSALVLRAEDETDQTRALIGLSRGGADATVIREFDLQTGHFIAPADGGFFVPEAKSDIDWIDVDTVYLGTDTGAGSLTDSGYPRTALRWRRGTDRTAAETVFEGEHTDVAVSVWFDRTPGFERSFAERSVDFHTSHRYQLAADGTPIRIDVPDDARVSAHREWLLVRTRSPWTVAGTTHPAGALLAARYADYLAGSRELTVLFTPDEHTSLEQYAWTRHHLLLVTLSDVRTQLRVLTPSPTDWSDVEMPGVPDLTSTDVLDVDPIDSDEFFLNSSGYLTPATLLHGYVGEPIEALKQAPAFFDTANLSVTQHFATSDDGTAVPYFLVRRNDPTPRSAGSAPADHTGRSAGSAPADQVGRSAGSAPAAPGPTLLYGYGGFENSMLPGYSGALGLGWLERGGTYVVANIRGGGEYGPGWHTQALKAGRHKAFEDFAAVARDLVVRGVTTAAQLGAQGGSNGGLLMGVMLTRYPELFGAVVCQVPLLDMRRYHLLLAGASWMAEYGDPDDPDQWAYIGKYSPYQNADPNGAYPPVLITTSTRDDRVHPGHARKMAARLTEQGHRVWYYENIEGGHGGAADNAQLAFKSALAYEFLWQTLT